MIHRKRERRRKRAATVQANNISSEAIAPRNKKMSSIANKENTFVERLQYLTVFTSKKCNLRRKPGDHSVINVDEDTIVEDEKPKRPENGYFAEQVTELLLKEGWKVKKVPEKKKVERSHNSSRHDSRRGSFEHVLSRLNTPKSKVKSVFSIKTQHDPSPLDPKSVFSRGSHRRNTFYPAMTIEKGGSKSPQSTKPESPKKKFVISPKTLSKGNLSPQKRSVVIFQRSISRPKSTQTKFPAKPIMNRSRGNLSQQSDSSSGMEVFKLTDDLKRRCFIKTAKHEAAASSGFEKDVILGMSQKDKLHPASFPVEISYKINKGLITKDRFGVFINPNSKRLQDAKQKAKSTQKKNNMSALL